MLQNHTWVEDPFIVQDRPVDFSGTESEKFSDRVADPALLSLVQHQRTSESI